MTDDHRAIRDLHIRNMDEEKAKEPVVQEPKVKFIHLRDFAYNGDRGIYDLLLSTGGATLAFKREGEEIKFAFAKCHKKDNFVKKVGRQIAEGKMKSTNFCYSIPFEGQEHKAIVDAITEAYYVYEETRIERLDSNMRYAELEYRLMRKALKGKRKKR